MHIRYVWYFVAYRHGWHSLFILERKFTFKGTSPPIIFARMERPVNFVADNIHTKKLSTRLSSSEVQFYMGNSRFAFFEPLFVGLRTMFYERKSIENRHFRRNSVSFAPDFMYKGSAVTPSKKSLVNANRSSTTHFPMSPRWTSFVVPKPSEGAQKHKMAVFPLKSHFAWRKSATKFLCVKTVSDKVVGQSCWPNHPCKND